MLVTLYGEGLYAADTWLIGAGNRGPAATALLAGVLAFFGYFYVSMVFATAQNRLFPVYVAAAACACFALALVAARIDTEAVAVAMPDRPGVRALLTYLLAVAAALTLAWLPSMVATAVTGDIAPVVGPYTSATTEALNLGLVVPVAIIAAVQLARHRSLGRVLTLVLLVLNVCIGLVLMGQGIAQLVSGVPLTVGEIVAKMLTFAALTLVAGGLLARMAWAAQSHRSGGDPMHQVDAIHPTRVREP